MKYAKFAAVVFVLYFLGYVLGPTITPMLVDDKEKESDLVQEVEFNGAVYTIDLAEYRDADLPQTVKIRNPVTIPTTDGEGEVRLSKGDVVNLLNRKDDQLIIENPQSNGKGKVSPEDTDIYMVLAQKKFEKAVADRGGAMAEITPPVPKPAPAPVPSPAPAPGPEPVAVVEAPTPTPAVEPMPEPAPTPAPAGGGKLTDGQIEELMKKSIAGGAVKEFKTEQVKGWKASGEETIDGTEYQTGLAAYEAATIFGVRPVQAKALIKDGKIERWVYAKSGMEIQ